MMRTDNTNEIILFLIFISTWVCGIAVAKGLQSTILAIFFFPYAWVILAKHFLVG